ncbi:LPXTG-motif cell wall anchor domain protein [Trichoderma sp. SZMC 28014]
MTETASFTTARYGQAASTAASLPGKSLAASSAASITGPSSNLHSHRQSHNSSKLPSFRFADIKNGSAASSHSQPLSPVAKSTLGLSSRQLAPPVASSVSAASQSDVAPRDRLKTRSDPVSTKILASSATARNRQAPPASEKLPSPPRPNLRPRASYQTTIKPAAVEQIRRVRRPLSYPDSLANEAAQSAKTTTSVARSSSLRQTTRRLPASSRSSNANGAVTPEGPRTSLSARYPTIDEAISPTTRSSDPKPTTRERTQTQRDLPASRPLPSAGLSDENQDQSQQRPPVSYKPLVNNATAGQPTPSIASRLPPTRGIRSSGSRKSSTDDDMSYNSRGYDAEDRYIDSTDDHTLRASDGDFFEQKSPPDSRHGANGGDDTGDVFLKIASEEAARNSETNNASDRPITYKISRTSSQRPLSYAATSYYPVSPPSVNMSRRLSDQQDRERRRSVRYEDEITSEVARSSAYRSSQLRDKVTSSRPSEDSSSRAGSSGLRPSLMTPRSAGYQDQAAENSLYNRRKSSVVDSASSSSARSPTHKATVLVQSHAKAYNPSPLNRSFEMQDEEDEPDAGNFADGTESTTSTNAPSTVWDELDDLKSRIHRLELTGKLPPTSAAALIKASEDRPPTATTTVTTMSLSPRKSAAGHQTDAGSSTSSHGREAHSNLHSALGKIKAILSPDVYRALETAANDALALSSMMGTPGQPGPISGSASVVSGGGGPAITDRQLRRRTDSVCRSLTELCIALGEDTARPAVTVPQVITTQPSSARSPSSHPEPPKTPTMMNSKTYSVSRRSSVVPEQATQIISSPRATSKYEERRSMMLNGNPLTSPRASASTPATPNDSMSAARRASLVISRARRAVTEEADDGRKSTALLRSRRLAGDESDEGGRRTSFLVRNRRGTVGEEDEGARFRAPSRAITEVNGTRGSTREYPYTSDVPTPLPEVNTPQAPSALSRRRLLTSGLQPSRLTVPSTAATPTTRRFLERSLPGGVESGPERSSENRLSRHLSVQHGSSNHTSTYQSLQNRTSSLQIRRTNRENLAIPASSTTASNGLR